MDLFYTAPINNGVSIAILWQYFNAGVFVDYSFYVWTPTAGQTWDDFEAAALAAQASYASGHSYTVANAQMWYGHVQTALSIPMYVNGVAKTGYSAATGSAVVAGGSGVARFYIDENNDGSGAALFSEVFADSVQAYVLNASNVYIPSAVSVDASRKYVDITFKQQTFSSSNALITLLGGLASFLTGATFGAAPNGTAVKILVLGKK